MAALGLSLTMQNSNTQGKCYKHFPVLMGVRGLVAGKALLLEAANNEPDSNSPELADA
jgi:hypothetical protein